MLTAAIMMMQLGSGLVPVGLLALMALADARDGARLDELRRLSLQELGSDAVS